MSKKQQQQIEMQMRSGAVEARAAEGDKPASLRMSISSEEPVLTYIRFNDQYLRAYEILDHQPGSINMKRAKEGLVIRDRHHGDQVARMTLELKEKKLSGVPRFGVGARSQEIAADAAAGIRRELSVGYQVDETSYRLEGNKDGIPVVRAMSWMPYEASFEPVPADVTVGVGRGAEEDQIAADAAHNERKEGTKEMKPEEMAAMFSRAAKYGIGAEKVQALIADGKGRAELDAMIVEKQEADATELRKEVVTLKERKPDATRQDVTNPGPVGGDIKTADKIVKRYSLVNVCRKLMGANVDVGFENEITQEARRGAHRSQSEGAFTVPHAVLLGKRATALLESTSTASVATNLMAGEFIDVLRPYSILPALGVRVMSGLVGNVSIPKMTAAGSGYWVAEGVDITRLAPVLGSITLSPHTVGAACDVSYLMAMQSTPSAEQMVSDDIVRSIATKVEAAVFATGGAGAPTPITSASGINNPTVTAGTPTYAQMLAFIGDILEDSAAAPGQKWAISAATWTKLAATFTDGTAKAQVLLDYIAGKLLGYPYEVSENVGTNAAFFGAWNTVVLGTWGQGIELNVDTSTLSLAGGRRIVGLQLVDVAVRHGEALSYNASVAA
jgi:HK97 family phage major capsid protein